MASFDWKKNIEDFLKNRLIITTVTAMTAGIFFGLGAMYFGEHDALIVSTSLVWLMFLPMWKR